MIIGGEKPGDAEQHVHEFKKYRDGRPARCKCGAWLKVTTVIVTDEPLPDPLRQRFGDDAAFEKRVEQEEGKA